MRPESGVRWGPHIVETALVATHNRIEVLGIKIDKPRLAPPQRDSLQHCIAQRGAEAVRHRMAIDDQHPHQNASILAATFDMKLSRVCGVDRFIE